MELVLSDYKTIAENNEKLFKELSLLSERVKELEKSDAENSKFICEYPISVNLKFAERDKVYTEYHIEPIKKEIKKLDDEINITNNKLGESGVNLYNDIRQLKKDNHQLKQDFAILLHTNFVDKVHELGNEVAIIKNKIALMVQKDF